MKFAIFKTKIREATQKPSARAKLGAGLVPHRNEVPGAGFDLAVPQNRKVYFELKAKAEIKKLRDYLKKNTFIVYLLGKKNSGKGTYSKMFAEIIDPERIEHFSIGDMIRGIDKELKDKKKKKELIEFLEKNYRGWSSIKELISLLEKRSTTTPLLPTELILVLTKRAIAKRKKKALFIDGFPRDLDQISYSLFFRDLIGYRNDPDIFVLIDVPEKVIDKRIKYRVVCPRCQSTRNLKLHPVTKEKIKYDKKSKEFYFICDNPACKRARMIQKEGDEFGIEPIKERLKKDEKLIQKSFSLYGIPKILLRNFVPVKKAKQYVEDYEITPEYNYLWDEKKKKVEVIKKPWIFPDNEGISSYSLLPPVAVLSLIKQMVETLYF